MLNYYKMNKPLLNLKQRVESSYTSRFKMIFGLVVWALASYNVQAQVDCNIIMACNDNVQVSLGDLCTERLTPDMILEDPTYADPFYTVTLWRENGNVVVDNILRRTMIGETLSARIKLTGCDVSCWGNLTVEDKLPPVITGCTSPVEIECEDSTAPGVKVPRPVATDACANGTFTFSDVTKTLLCSSPYTKTITRTWIATDLYGNKSTCVQIINVKRASISDVTFPADKAGATAYECGAAIKYLPSGAPHPDASGYPTGVACGNINNYYEDVIFDLCGNGIKVLRQWNVIDWCTGRDTVGNQIIKVLDTKPAICISPPDFKFNIFTDEGKCTGTFTVPAPNVAFECSSYDYIVGYKLRDANGNPFENPVYDNVSKITNPNGSYYYKIANLPQDTSWIVYTITDACGHVTKCFTEVIVKDNEKPSAICEGYSVVTLGSDGWADVYAISIDDHSKDNCEIEKYEIKRLIDNCSFPTDLQFGKYVNFCCNDVSPNPNDYIKVVLRVYDISGNHNDCVANVKVEDKINPTISCPPSRQVQCDSDFSAATLGRATGTDNCSLVIDSTDVVNLNRCGKGSISRRWKATDPGGRTASCTQTITVIDFNPFNSSNITFPADITINGCTFDDADPVLTGSLPTYTNSDCAEISVSYEDTKFTVQGACFMITRKWRLADWCSFDAQNPVYFEGAQKITLRNSAAPQFVSSCSNRTIQSTDNDCEEYVEHSAEATDDCTPSDQIKYRWEYDEKNNGSIDKSGNGAFTAAVYPTGKHKFTFYATDLCNNTTKCSYFFTITDGKAPTPICHREIVWVLDEKGEATVWASDFDLKSTDQCDDDANLRFAFDAAGLRAVQSFDCSDVPNGISAELDLRMYVFDTDGNKEYCEVRLILQDSENTDACPDQPGARAMIAGDIINHSDNGLMNIGVNIKNMDSNESSITHTNQDGHFEYINAQYYGEYAVEPTSNDDLLNGVSTLDLVLIQRHILGINKIDGPTNLISADINADNKVTAADLVALRKAILGITNQYQNNNSWRFVPTNHIFDDATYPWGFPENISIHDLMVNYMKSDFKAIKIGDVNNSSKANARGNVSENRSTGLDVLVDNVSFEAGETLEIPVYAGQDKMISGLQMSIDFDDYAFEINGIKSNGLALEGGMYNIDGSMVKISYATHANMDISKGDVLFTLVVETKEANDLSSLILSNDQMISEVYDQSYESGKLDLIIRKNVLLDGDIQIVKNAPNPFSNTTEIAVNLNNDETIALTIFDISGKKVFANAISGSKGINTIIVNRSDLGNKSGMYFFQAECNDKMYTGKMIMIE